MAKSSKKTQPTSAAAAAPATLGNKRQCPSCGTKFYDFGKEEPNCPKCQTKVGLESPKYVTKPEKKVRQPVEEEEVATDSDDSDAGGGFESLESLEDDSSDDIVETLDVEDKDEEDEGF